MDNDGTRPNARRGAGYSLRRSLIEQGVNDELEINRHINKVAAMLKSVPTLDITLYRVSRA